jgi:hypothetical protein
MAEQLDLNTKYPREELEKLDDASLGHLATSNVPRTQRLAAQILRERHPKPLSEQKRQKRADEETRLREEGKRAAEQEKKIQAEEDRLRRESPRIHSEAVLRGMFAERTPRQAARYVDAAISWNDVDPAAAAIAYAVAAWQGAGVRLEQKGANNSWYGTTADGKSVRIADHLGFEAHDVDLVFDSDLPPLKDAAMAEVVESLESAGLDGNNRQTD